MTNHDGIIQCVSRIHSLHNFICMLVGWLDSSPVEIKKNYGTNVKIQLEPGKNGMPVCVNMDKPAFVNAHTRTCALCYKGHHPLHTV
jgi:hypothetical protein